MRTHQFSDPGALARGVALWLSDLAATSAGDFAIALSGGSTPRHLYGLLATQPFRDVMPWERIHWFWGDERFVPADHPDSNYRMAREVLFDHVPVPAGLIHPVETGCPTPAEAAERYERRIASLRTRLGRGAGPFFDLVLLGVGDDGHTASLFPGTDTLDEGDRWVTCITGARPEPRITLTYPALRSSRHVAFLAAGKAKRDVIRAIWTGADYPAARVSSEGDIHWFLDEAATPADLRAAEASA